MGKISKFLALPISLKKLIFESIFYSIWYEICLKLNLYRYIKELHKNKPADLQTANDDYEVIIIVRKTMRALRKYAPWRPECYNVALVSKRVLLNRAIESTIHIGFNKKSKTNSFAGHAWVTHKDKVVAGFIEGGLKKYKKLS